jgi:ubiquinone/menaquinone biosynthesis C-methylase UbiE
MGIPDERKKRKKIMSGTWFRTRPISWWDPDENNESIKEQNRYIFNAIKQNRYHRILEVGIGRGRILAELKKMGKEAIAIEINPDFIRFCKERERKEFSEGIHVNFIEANVEYLPLRNNSFNAVLCIATFMHFPKPKEALEEMARVLEAKGLLVMTFTQKKPRSYLKYLFKRYFWQHIDKANPIDYKLYSINKVKKFLKGGSLEIEKLYLKNSAGPVIVLRKKPKNNATIP